MVHYLPSIERCLEKTLKSRKVDVMLEKHHLSEESTINDLDYML